MKKVLFASTALVAGAFAAPQFASAQSVSAGNADITLGGYARWGLGYNEDRAQESILISRFRLDINASVETDTGLRFSGVVRGQSDENATGTAGPLTFGGARFDVSAGGLEVRFGNISGVFDDGTTIRPFRDNGLEGQIGMVSSFGFPGPAFGNGSANNGMLARYEFGDFTVAASYVDESQNVGGVEDTQIGFGYAFNGYNIGFVYGTQDPAGAGADNDYYAISFDGSIGDFGFGVIIGENEINDAVQLSDGRIDGGDIAYGFGIDYDVSAATNVSFIYSGGGLADVDGGDDAYSIGFLHDLGSGASLRGFVGQNLAGSTVADFGVRFNF